MINLDIQSPSDIAAEIAERVKTRRKEKKWTQEQLAERSGVSFGSYKRFERIHEISLDSLIKIAIALKMEKDFDSLFAKKTFSSLDELIASEKRK